ncbi:MAG: O-antigen ligase family protein [Proteobacteria bacterium]|nr:O-antigen ligase family protein [Pseudomonadota bacterium]MBU1688212.1 O-antigen ligase family protein [Pseudomonadota bacterium]
MTTKLSFICYLAALVIAPLAFGTVEPWSITLMEGTILFALLLFLTDRLLHRDRPIKNVPGLIFLLVLSLYFLGQILPLPPGLMKILSPRLFVFHQSANAASEGALPWLPLSAIPAKTLGEFFRFTTYAAAFFLTIQFGANRKRLETIITTMVITGAVIALESMAQTMTANGQIYWFRPSPSSNTMGPFIYHNHYAGYMEMVFPLALGLFFHSSPPKSRAGSPRERFLDFFAKPQLNRHALYGIAATLMVTSVFVSLSRGGIICLCLSLLVMVILLQQKGLISSRWLLAILIPSVTVIFIGWFGWDKIVERFLLMYDEDLGISNGRFTIWSDTLPMIKEFWLTGSGAGSYEHVYPAYQTKHLFKMMVNHAHQDYLELLATTGIIGFSLLLFFLSRLFLVSTGLVKKRRSPFAAISWTAALTGITAILLHGFLDFNFYNASNGLYFFTLCGLLQAGAIAKRPSRKKGKPPRETPPRSQLWPVIAGLTGSLILIGTMLTINIQAMAASARFDALKSVVLTPDTPQDQLLAMNASITKAEAQAPLNFYHPYLKGNVAVFQGDVLLAKQSFLRSLQLNPVRSETLLRMAELGTRGVQGIEPEHYYRAAEQADRSNPEIYLNFAGWLFSQGRKAEGLTAIRQGVTLSGNFLPEAMTMLNDRGMGSADLLKAIPDDLNSRLTLGRLLDRIGRHYGATYVYRHIEKMVDDERSATPGIFKQLVYHYSRMNETEDALRILNKAITVFPDDPSLHLLLGDQLSKAKRPDEAEATYRAAVTMAPEDPSPRLKLAAHLKRSGQKAAAVIEYDQVATILATWDRIDPRQINQLSSYYLNTGRSDEALTVIRQAIATMPGDLQLRLLEGDTLIKLGRKLEATKLFQQILAANPGQEEARKRLEEL